MASNATLARVFLRVGLAAKVRRVRQHQHVIREITGLNRGFTARLRHGKAAGQANNQKGGEASEERNRPATSHSSHGNTAPPPRADQRDYAFLNRRCAITAATAAVARSSHEAGSGVAWISANRPPVSPFGPAVM